MHEKLPISVALCTHNGERHLGKQLESIARQTLLPYELVVCDDASRDATGEILEQFSRSAPFKVRFYRNEQALGIVRNFSKAMGLCEGTYIALSDQDDIWLPEKLAQSCRKIKEVEQKLGADTPLLVHTDLRLIDAEDREAGGSFLGFQKIRHIDEDPLKTVLARNFVTGCTCMFNRALANVALPVPENVFMHDWWLATAAACTGKILFIPEEHVLYRQHGSNALGAQHPLYSNIRALMKRSKPGKAVTIFLQLHTLAKELQKRLATLNINEPPFLGEYIRALETGGLTSAFRVLFHAGVRTQGLIPNLIFFTRIARGQHIEYLKKPDRRQY